MVIVHRRKKQYQIGETAETKEFAIDIDYDRKQEKFVIYVPQPIAGILRVSEVNGATAERAEHALDQLYARYREQVAPAQREKVIAIACQASGRLTRSVPDYPGREQIVFQEDAISGARTGIGLNWAVINRVITPGRSERFETLDGSKYNKTYREYCISYTPEREAYLRTLEERLLRTTMEIHRLLDPAHKPERIEQELDLAIQELAIFD